eukprot:2714861-Rhodomonas_salina.5
MSLCAAPFYPPTKSSNLYCESTQLKYRDNRYNQCHGTSCCRIGELSVLDAAGHGTGCTHVSSGHGAGTCFQSNGSVGTGYPGYPYPVPGYRGYLGTPWTTAEYLDADRTDLGRHIHPRAADAVLSFRGFHHTVCKQGAIPRRCAVKWYAWSADSSCLQSVGWGAHLADAYTATFRSADIVNRGFAGYNTRWALL